MTPKNIIPAAILAVVMIATPVMATSQPLEHCELFRHRPALRRWMPNKRKRFARRWFASWTVRRSTTFNSSRRRRPFFLL